VKHTRGDDGVDRWVPDRVLRFGVVKHTWGDDGFDRWFLMTGCSAWNWMESLNVSISESYLVIPSFLF